MIGTCVPAGVIPFLNTLAMVSSSPCISLYLCLKCFGYLPEYLSRLLCGFGDAVAVMDPLSSSVGVQARKDDFFKGSVTVKASICDAASKRIKEEVRIAISSLSAGKY